MSYEESWLLLLLAIVASLHSITALRFAFLFYLYFKSDLLPSRMLGYHTIIIDSNKQTESKTQRLIGFIRRFGGCASCRASACSTTFNVKRPGETTMAGGGGCKLLLASLAGCRVRTLLHGRLTLSDNRQYISIAPEGVKDTTITHR